MQAVNRFIDVFRSLVRRGAEACARFLNAISGGKLSPNAITLFGFFMHIPIALLIARGYFIYAAILLIVFGLFDTLDGSLARLQNRSSKFGMLLDSVTDRMKEVLIYIGIGYYFVSFARPYYAVWAIAACGAGLLVSYINAWGEVVTKDLKESHETNKAFRGGIMSFDVRMFTIVVGLLTGYIAPAVIIIAILSCLTALDRLSRISQRLLHAQD